MARYRAGTVGASGFVYAAAAANAADSHRGRQIVGVPKTVQQAVPTTTQKLPSAHSALEAQDVSGHTDGVKQTPPPSIVEPQRHPDPHSWSPAHALAPAQVGSGFVLSGGSVVVVVVVVVVGAAVVVVVVVGDVTVPVQLPSGMQRLLPLPKTQQTQPLVQTPGLAAHTLLPHWACVTWALLDRAPSSPAASAPMPPRTPRRVRRLASERVRESKRDTSMHIPFRSSDHEHRNCPAVVPAAPAHDNHATDLPGWGIGGKSTYSRLG